MAHAQAAIISVPAPTGSAGAVAVKVGNLVSVGQTAATAGQNGATASAAPITIAGKPIGAGVTKATTSGSGAAYDSGQTPIGQLQVLPWATNVSSDHSSGSAAVAVAELPNNAAGLAVAPSYSFASWTPSKSTSSAVSDGAVLHFGQYQIKVLHSESSASGFGKTYLVQLFGKNIALTDSKGCMLDVGPLAKVGCLQALKGVGSDAEVAQALIGTNAPFGKVIAAAATGGSAQLASAVQGADLARTPTAHSLLARTGTSSLLMIAVGMLLVAAGMVARFGSRRLEVLPVR
jgi:hypothetical protein